MLTLNDGRSELWQWDTGRTLSVDSDCSQVHFSNKVFGRSIDVDVVDGAAIIPDVLLQTDKDLNVWAFVGTADNGYTKISKTFKVNRRNKPADYVFTPTDQMTLQTIQSQIGDLADLTTEAKDTLVAAINEAARTGGGAGSMDLRVADGYVQYSTDGGMTWTNLIAMAELKGADGITPTIGSNGNWYLGDTDTGKPSRGEKGDEGQPGKDGQDGSPGKDGAEGKSAYQYAQEGGYTGTETEFAAKLAEEIPTVDTTLTQSGKAADAKAVGDALAGKQDKLIAGENITIAADGKTISATGGGGGGGGGIGVTEYHASNNLYDAENLVGTHTINGSSVSGLSNWIPVKAKTKYASDAHRTQYYFFDADKNYLSHASYMTSPVVVTAPQDGFLLIKTNGNTETIVVEGTYLGNHYEGYYALKESLTKRVSKADNNTWAGKKWLAIGDSLTDPAVASEGYPHLVSKALGLTLTNVGASGKVMNWFVDRIPDYADDFDLVTVLLGTNNQGFNCEIGSLNDGVDYTTNNSFYAQTQKVAEMLMEKYPAAVIAFLTPIRRTGVGGQNNNDEGYMINALGLTTEPYAEAVKEVADYYGLPCLDLYHNGINPKSEWMRRLYFVNSDGTHPNNEGHAKYTAPIIKTFLESLAPFGKKAVTYSVTNNLTNAANSNSATSVEEGASYSATITANDGYELSEVIVTMGGTDISASAVSGGEITIESVTGNIVITATATEVDSGEPVLVHSYIGTSVPESGALKDQTGSFDLINKSGNLFFSNYAAENGSAFALSTGDSASFKFVNVFRNTIYYSHSCKMDTSGNSQWHAQVGGNLDTTGRIKIYPYNAPEEATNTTFGDATPQVWYRQDDDADGTEAETKLYSNVTVPKGETHTITVTVNAVDKSIKMYVDGTLVIDEVMTAEPKFDGLSVSVYAECPFDRLEVYRGIITDVT